MKKITGLISIILVVVFWGISFLSIESILKVVNPVVLGFFRYVLAAIFVGILVIAKRENLHITKADFLVFFLAGLLGIFLYSVLESTAMLYISASAASIFTALAPMAMVLGNFLVYRERVSVTELILILASIGGVFLVLYKDLKLATGLMDIVGYLFMVASIVSWTVYSLLTKKITRKYSSLKVTALQSFMALVIFIPTLFVAPLPNFAAFSVIDWVNLLFLGVVCSGLCYYLYIHSVDALGVTIPSLFLNFIPVITILCGVIIFKAPIDIYQIAGGIIVTIAMTLMTVENLKKTQQN
jgi:drug/metabolite transporter (DMT)-like permease